MRNVSRMKRRLRNGNVRKRRRRDTRKNTIRVTAKFCGFSQATTALDGYPAVSHGSAFTEIFKVMF
jgi:hypothetical protein